MDNHSTSPLRKVSLPTFAGSVPVEIAALPASTRTSFTRVDNNTRPGTAAGDNNDAGDETVLPDGAPAQVPRPEDESEQVMEAAVVVPQVPQTLVQFLLVSGRRRSMAFDPETTVGRVKELVWNTWPCGTPTTPSLPLLCLSLYLSRTYTAQPYRSRNGPGRSGHITFSLSTSLWREFCHFEYGRSSFSPD